MMKVLVTGASGFVGGHLVEALGIRGDEVRALVRPGDDVEGLRMQKHVELVYGDITQLSSLAAAMQGVRQVYHLAAMTSPAGTREAYHAINIDGLANIIFTALSAGVARVIYTSDTVIYGQHLNGMVTEETAFLSEENHYSRSRAAGEKLIANLVRDCRAPVVTIRPGYIYGPRDRGPFGRLLPLIARGRGYIIGSGENILPLIYIGDVVRALLRAGEASEQVHGQTYTIIHDQQVTQAQYMQTVAEFLGAPPVRYRLPAVGLYRVAHRIERLQERLNDHHTLPPLLRSAYIAFMGGDYHFSNEHARQELGFVPTIDLKQGIYETVQWYKKRPYNEVGRGDSASHVVNGKRTECKTKQDVEGKSEKACV